MNKRMREIMALIESKTEEAKSFMSEDNKDIEKATSLMDEVDALKKEYALKEKLFEAEKMAVPEPTNEPKEKELTEVQKFAKAIREGIVNKGMSEGVDADGGYTVPEDIVAKVEQYRQVSYDLGNDIDVEPVSTNKGARTFQKKGQAEAFEDVNELAAIGKEIPAPQFERNTFNIKDRAGFMPVSNDLIEDSDENIQAVVVDWLANANVATNNKNVLDLIKTKTQVDLKNLDGIKEALLVTLGQAYADGATIYTNDDGLHYLDTLKDKNDRYLLSPVPSEPTKMQITIGARAVPVKVIPNAIWATTGKKIPFVIGNLADYIRKYDRRKTTIEASTVASIGTFNAFAQNMTLFRAITRNDFVVKDADSIVYGQITPATATP